MTPVHTGRNARYRDAGRLGLRWPPPVEGRVHATQAAFGRATAGVEDIVLSNSRGPATLHDVAARLGGTTRTGTAAAAADIVVLSVPWSRIPVALAQVPDWTGRVLVDTTNPIEAPAFPAADLGGRTASEIVAAQAPGARLVKGSNHLDPCVLAADPRIGGGRRVAFYSGDDKPPNAPSATWSTGSGLKASTWAAWPPAERCTSSPAAPYLPQPRQIHTAPAAA